MKRKEKGGVSNSIYFLRHAETSVDPSLPVNEWSITPRGLLLARELARSEVFGKIEGIVHSSEKKARQTADVFAEELAVDIYEIPELAELKRHHGKFLSNPEYRSHVRDTLTDWDHSVREWESGADAIRRFVEGVKRINFMFYSRNILAISHGIVLTLYFCQLRNFQSIAYERWTQTPFLAWGLVRDGRVLIDIL
ncbi:MAG: histidine phosphatase family protein [Candidatus Odinarchaeota archaeon]